VVLNAIVYLAFGIAALVISQNSNPAEVAACDPSVTNYTGLLLVLLSFFVEEQNAKTQQTRVSASARS
jgi:hypothetical protein